jgi:hypothetical protein
MRKKILIYVLIIILVLVFVYLGYAWGKEVFPFGSGKYQAVQLINGDVYYGHLAFFPAPKLTDVYYIQQVPSQEEDGQPSTQLVPLNALFFGPENTMRLEKSQILWWADLAENSQILKAIEEQK